MGFSEGGPVYIYVLYWTSAKVNTLFHLLGRSRVHGGETHNSTLILDQLIPPWDKTHTKSTEKSGRLGPRYLKQHNQEILHVVEKLERLKSPGGEPSLQNSTGGSSKYEAKSRSLVISQ